MYEGVPIPVMNTAIAVFLGGEVREVWRIQGKPEMAWTGKIAHQWRKEMLGIGVGEAILVNHLKFDSSIEWLWPVWIKIQNTGADCGISFKPYHIAFHVAIDQGAILAAHRACFDFIKRYNEINNEKENNKRSHL